MTDPKLRPASVPNDDVEDASKPLDTEAGSETADRIGSEHNGPTKAPDAEGGAYVIP